MSDNKNDRPAINSDTWTEVPLDTNDPNSRTISVKVVDAKIMSKMPTSTTTFADIGIITFVENKLKNFWLWLKEKTNEQLSKFL